MPPEKKWGSPEPHVERAHLTCRPLIDPRPPSIHSTGADRRGESGVREAEVDDRFEDGGIAHCGGAGTLRSIQLARPALHAHPDTRPQTQRHTAHSATWYDVPLPGQAARAEAKAASDKAKKDEADRLASHSAALSSMTERAASKTDAALSAADNAAREAAAAKSKEAKAASEAERLALNKSMQAKVCSRLARAAGESPARAHSRA